MGPRLAVIAACIALLSTSEVAEAQISPEAAEALRTPPQVERTSALETVPLIPHMGKFAIQAEINGAERRFIFDTGSPTMISRELADELGLTVIGTNTGRDANGREVTTQIAVVDELTIGGLTFSKVPVMIADFSVSDQNGCFFDGGVIGSEIFPGSVWHFDGDRRILQIAGDIGDIPGLDATPETAVTDLHIGGYPYPPIFTYRFGKFVDRGLFDTGSSDTVVLFDRVLRDEQVRQAIVPDSLAKGRGSHGVSAGGIGAESDLVRFDVEGLELGTTMPRLPATTRSAPPSLIGLGLLDRFAVTLDYVANRMHLYERADAELAQAHPGFAVMMRDGSARVVQLFEGSPAQRAGLVLGDEVAAIDGRSLGDEEEPCSVVRWLAEDRPTYEASTLTVVRDGQAVELTIREK